MPSTKALITSLLTITLLSTPSIASWSNIPQDKAYAASAVNTVPAAPKANVLPLKWKVDTDGMAMYDSKQPIVNGVLFYSSNNTLYAKNISTGKILWSYKQGEHPQIVTNNSVFFIDPKQQLVKVSAATGKLIWKVKVAEQVIEIGAQARLINGTVYFANEHGGVAAYDPVTGKKLWENEAIPMYAGTIYGEFSDVLVVSSTVNNIRTQFFGLDPVTGKRLWRIEGLYSYVTHQKGQLLLREHATTPSGTDGAAVPGYQLALVQLDPVTGNISGREKYNLLGDISRLGNFAASVHNPYVYSVDGNLDKDEYILTRFTRAAAADTTFKSYEAYGKWLAGPVGEVAYFQQESQISGLNLANDSVVAFDNLSVQAGRLQRAGKAVFTIYDNGYISVNHADTGALLGVINSGSTYSYFGNITIDHGIALIPTEHHILALALPKEYQ